VDQILSVVEVGIEIGMESVAEAETVVVEAAAIQKNH